MNLLQLLLQTMLSGNSVNSVSQKTGLSSKLVKKLITLAIPVLIKYLTSNVSSQSGALSLLSALTKHNNTRSMSEQIDEVDEEDGGKIIGHILGDDKEKVVKELAAETGIENKQVDRSLGLIAPALLAVLAATLTSAKKPKPQQQQQAAAAPAANAIDLTSLLSTFAGSQQQQNNGFGLDDVLGLLAGAKPQQTQQQTPSLLGTLLGAQPQQQQTQANPMNSLLGTLLGAQPQQTQQQQTPSLLGTLLGSPKPQQAQQPQIQVQQVANSIDGTDLINALLQAMVK
ncbi:MAG: DUF937 domain-containing protein [Erysipelotrichaceae bacterium]|nr:DUF937 domain-containing protein [Erysipelotrichaceae bacterium]